MYLQQADQALVENADLFRNLEWLLIMTASRYYLDLMLHIYLSRCLHGKGYRLILYELNCGIHALLVRNKRGSGEMLCLQGKTPIAHMLAELVYPNTTLAAHCVHVSVTKIWLLWLKIILSVVRNP